MTRTVAIAVLTLSLGASLGPGPPPASAPVIGRVEPGEWTALGRTEPGGRADHHARPGQEARVERISLESRVFGNTRTLRVWLPPGYEDGARGGGLYPVLYLNDGQSLFASTGDGRGREATWRAGVTALELIGSGRIEPIVVVGIDNAGAGRAREYLPWPDPFLDPPEPAPLGRRYVDFLRDEVIPAIEARFRVRRDPAGRALGGASYGALIAAYVAAADDGLFDGLLLESPSFYVDDGRIFRLLRDAGHTLRRVYLGVGTNEVAVEACGDHAWNREAVRDVRRMARVLAEAGRGHPDRDPPLIEVVEEECAAHGEAAWARRLPRALETLFGR